jgi:hypothetical protein
VIFLAKNKGDEYKCDECGLVITVMEPFDCDESCELVCCQEPMKQVKGEKAKQSAAAPKAKTTKK